MPFTPQHDYESYNAAVAKKMQSRTEPSFDEKFQKYADYYNALMHTRHRLEVGSTEAKLQRKREKFQRHVRLVQAYNTLDRLRNEK